MWRSVRSSARCETNYHFVFETEGNVTGRQIPSSDCFAPQRCCTHSSICLCRLVNVYVPCEVPTELSHHPLNYSCTNAAVPCVYINIVILSFFGHWFYPPRDSFPALLPSSTTSVFFLFMVRPCVSGVAPIFLFPPTDQTVTEGTTAFFTCQTRGAPKPAITWRKGTIRPTPEPQQD